MLVASRSQARCFRSFVRVFVPGLFMLSVVCCQKKGNPAVNSPFHDGDVIFQSLPSGRSDAIQLATHSKYSHCGIVFWEGGKCYVYEAFMTVRSTPLQKFLDRSKDRHYAVRRFRNADSLFSSDEVVRMFIKNYYKLYNGKPYDVYYAESDEKIYCSELVWKLYKASANVDLGPWQRLRDFDLNDPLVQEELTMAYGDKIPFDELIISPEALYTSSNLVTVMEK